MGKSILRHLKSNWLSISVISVLLFCLGLVFSILIMGIQNVSVSYSTYLDDQQTEDLSAYPNVTKSNPTYLEDISNDIAISEKDDINAVLQKDGKSMLNYANIDELAKKYEFSYEIYAVKEHKEKNMVYYVSQKMENINKTLLTEGHWPKKGEMLMSKKSAEIKDVILGDLVRIKGTDYKVVGYYYQPNQTYLHSAKLSDEIGTKNNIGVLLNQEDFKEVDVNSTESLSIKFDKGVSKDKMIDRMIDGDYFLTIVKKSNSNSITTVYNDIKSNQLLGSVIGICISIIALILTIILLSDIIIKLSKEIGLLIILGVAKSRIYFNLLYVLLFPILFLTIGGVLGIFLQPSVNSQITSLYNIPITMNVNSALVILIISVFFALGVSCYVIFIQKSKVKPIYLIYNSGNLKQRKLFSRLKLLVKKLPYYLRIKFSYLFYKPSFSLLLFVTIVLVFNLLSFSFGLMQSKTIQSEQYEDSNNYKGYVIHPEFQSLSNIPDKDTAIATTGEIEGTDINVIGLSIKNQVFTTIQDLKLADNSIILSKKNAKILEKEVGDTLSMNIDEKTIKFKLVKISELDYETRNFVNKDYLQKKLSNIPDDSYNVVFYSEKVPEILDNSIVITKSSEIKDLKTVMAQTDIIIFGILLLSLIIAVSMIILVSWLSVNDNKKSISMFKMLGANYMETYTLTTNVYTAVIVVSFLASWIINNKFVIFMESVLNDNKAATYNSIIVDTPSILYIVLLILVIYYIVLFASFTKVYLKIDTNTNKS